MSVKWILDQIKDFNDSQDIFIAVNPSIKEHIQTLLKKYWICIKSSLEFTGLEYSPQNSPTFEQDTIVGRLGYSVNYILLDQGSPFFRGKFICSKTDWMIESNFLTGFTKENQIDIILEILGNSKLSGNPPNLTIYKNSRHYYQLSFNSGFGASWAYYRDDDISDKIRENIINNARLAKYHRQDIIAENEFAEFMSNIYRVYET